MYTASEDIKVIIEAHNNRPRVRLNSLEDIQHKHSMKVFLQDFLSSDWDPSNLSGVEICNLISLLVYYRPYNYERMLNAIANKSKI